MSSTRQVIMDQVLSVLTNISGVNSVSESIKHYEEVDHADFPALFPIDTDEVKEPFVIRESSDNNMKSTLTLLITGMVWSATNVTRQARCDLIQAVEKAICYTGSVLTNIVHTVTPRRVITDKGSVLNYSIWDQEFEIEYFYDYKDGG